MPRYISNDILWNKYISEEFGKTRRKLRMEKGFEILIGVHLFVALLLIIFHTVTIRLSNHQIIVVPALGLISSFSHIILFFAWLTSGYKEENGYANFRQNLAITSVFVITQITACVISIVYFVHLFGSSPTSIILVLFMIIICELFSMIFALKMHRQREYDVENLRVSFV